MSDVAHVPLVLYNVVVEVIRTDNQLFFTDASDIHKMVKDDRYYAHIKNDISSLVYYQEEL